MPTQVEKARYSDDDMNLAIVEAIRALRNDEAYAAACERTNLGSSARREATKRILDSVGGAYGIPTEGLAMGIANARSHEACISAPSMRTHP